MDADAADLLTTFLAYPQVICFDVGARSDRHRLLPCDQVLLPSATPWLDEAVCRLKPVERLMTLVENDQGLLQLVECAPVADGRRPRGRLVGAGVADYILSPGKRIHV